jgi:hypothetical protein
MYRKTGCHALWCGWRLFLIYPDPGSFRRGWWNDNGTTGTKGKIQVSIAIPALSGFRKPMPGLCRVLEMPHLGR